MKVGESIGPGVVTLENVVEFMTDQAQLMELRLCLGHFVSIYIRPIMIERLSCPETLSVPESTLESGQNTSP